MVFHTRNVLNSGDFKWKLPEIARLHPSMPIWQRESLECQKLLGGPIRGNHKMMATQDHGWQVYAGSLFASFLFRQATNRSQDVQKCPESQKLGPKNHKQHMKTILDRSKNPNSRVLQARCRRYTWMMDIAQTSILQSRTIDIPHSYHQPDIPRYLTGAGFNQNKIKQVQCCRDICIFNWGPFQRIPKFHESSFFWTTTERCASRPLVHSGSQ